MQNLDLIVRNGTVVYPRGVPAKADIGIADGKFAVLGAPGSLSGASDEIDASGLHVFPGAVDPHTHLGLGGGEGEELRKDSAAAAIGGTTTVFWMISQPESYLPVVAENLEMAECLCATDFSFNLTLMSANQAEEVPKLRAEYGIGAYKFFMSFRGDEGRYMGVEGVDDGTMLEIMAAVAADGSVLAVHAENIEIVWDLRTKLTEAKRNDLVAWHESRPPFTEAEAVYSAAWLGAHTDCALYFVHMSSAEALDEIQHARARFPRATIYAETCPHYLTHTSQDPLGSLGKVNPPLRTDADREAAWKAIRLGLIDTVGTDHVGRKRSAKEGSIWTVKAGFPGIATLLPVLISEGYHKRDVSLSRIAEVTSKRPAEIFGVSHRKGDIRVGLDADLALIDLEWKRTVSAEDLGTWADYSLYDGWSLTGWPRVTIVGGRVVQKDGEVQAPGPGRYVPTNPHLGR